MSFGAGLPESAPDARHVSRYERMPLLPIVRSRAPPWRPLQMAGDIGYSRPA